MWGASLRRKLCGRVSIRSGRSQCEAALAPGRSPPQGLALRLRLILSEGLAKTVLMSRSRPCGPSGCRRSSLGLLAELNHRIANVRRGRSELQDEALETARTLVAPTLKRPLLEATRRVAQAAADMVEGGEKRARECSTDRRSSNKRTSGWLPRRLVAGSTIRAVCDGRVHRSRSHRLARDSAPMTTADLRDLLTRPGGVRIDLFGAVAILLADGEPAVNCRQRALGVLRLSVTGGGAVSCVDRGELDATLGAATDDRDDAVCHCQTRRRLRRTCLLLGETGVARKVARRIQEGPARAVALCRFQMRGRSAAR